MKNKFTLTCGIVLAYSMQLFAQVSPCGSTEMQKILFANDPVAEQNQKAYDQYCFDYMNTHYGSKSTANYIIPVVFHIIHNYGDENISDAQIYSTMEVLNRDYNKLNADTINALPVFVPIIANLRMEFRLAKIDPNGNCTNGIERIVSSKTNIGTDQAKLNPWPRKNYLNIWVSKVVGVAGAAAYAYKPGSVTGSNFIYDGVLTLSQYVGDIGTSTPYTSRTITHEIGHCLNLSHVWGDNNQPGQACGDDGVFDTPITKGYSSCPTPATAAICTPPIIENYHNYMDYSYCNHMFTEGQKQVMYAALNSSVSSRNNLWSQANLIQTGVLNTTSTCAPIAQMYAEKRFVCKNVPVLVEDYSTNGVPDTYSWSFPGGTCLLPNVKNPTVTYANEGSYDVTLTVSNANGSNTITMTDYIKVSPSWSDLPGSTVETFETGSSDWWNFVNIDNNAQQWRKIGFAGSSGTTSMMLNGEIESQGDVNELISPSFDLRYMSNLALTYKFTGASRNTYSLDITDKLTVYTSVDCGATWQQRKEIKGANLIKAGFVSGNYIPDANSWFTETIPLSNLLAVSGVRVKFKFTSGANTNNFYIDDVNFTGVTANNEIVNAGSMVSIMPNPAHGNANLSLTLPKTAMVSIELYDIVGAKVADIFQGQQANTTQIYTINQNADEKQLSKGIYFVRLTVDGKSTSTHKIIFN
jgi:PKD repeat protein